MKFLQRLAKTSLFAIILTTSCFSALFFFSQYAIGSGKSKEEAKVTSPAKRPQPSLKAVPQPGGGVIYPELEELDREAAEEESKFPDGIPALLGTPSSNPLEKENLLDFRDVDGLQGRLIYSRRTYVLPQAVESKRYFGYSATTSIVTRRITDDAKENADATAVYPLKINYVDSVMQPRFSSDGLYILFMLGWPFDEHGGFDLYLLETKTKKLRRLTKEKIVHENVQISSNARYIAFVRGADKWGYPLQNVSGTLRDKVRLFILDVRTGKERTVTTNDSVAIGGYAWTRDNTLVYSAIPPAPKPTASGKTKSILPRPNVYGIPAGSGERRLLISDAWRPVPSPDGKRIAFFGAEKLGKSEVLSSSWEENPKGATLSVADTDGQNRKALNREEINYPAVLWMDDGKFLISIKTMQEANVSRAALRKYDVAVGKFERLTALSAVDSEPLPRPLSQLPPFTPLRVTNDGKFLMTKIEEYGKRDKLTGMYDLDTTLLAVDLQNGKTSQVAKVRNTSGLDWHDESTPVATPSTPSTPQ